MIFFFFCSLLEIVQVAKKQLMHVIPTTRAGRGEGENTRGRNTKNAFLVFLGGFLILAKFDLV